MKLLLFLMLVAVAAGDIVPYKDCGSATGNIKSVDISGCSKLPCQLKRGTNIMADLDFISKTSSDKVTVVVTGEISGIPIPFPVDQPNGCESGIKCPLHKGDENNYKANLVIKSTYPKIKLVVKWELKDSMKQDLVCFEVPVEIV